MPLKILDADAVSSPPNAFPIYRASPPATAMHEDNVAAPRPGRSYPLQRYAFTVTFAGSAKTGWVRLSLWRIRVFGSDGGQRSLRFRRRMQRASVARSVQRACADIAANQSKGYDAWLGARFEEPVGKRGRLADVRAAITRSPGSPLLLAAGRGPHDLNQPARPAGPIQAACGVRLVAIFVVSLNPIDGSGALYHGRVVGCPVRRRVRHFRVLLERVS